jgi:hypothetical protein
MIMPMTVPATDRQAIALHEEYTPDVFPRDLADWMSPPKLQALAQRLAQRSSNKVVPVFSFQEQRMANPWRVLALWLYCTARGVCTPEAIRRFALNDVHARELCGTAIPSVVVISGFPEQNLRVLLMRLEELLATACLYAQHGTPFARCLKAFATGAAQSEAERRLSVPDQGGFSAEGLD